MSERFQSRLPIIQVLCTLSCSSYLFFSQLTTFGKKPNVYILEICYGLKDHQAGTFRSCLYARGVKGPFLFEVLRLIQSVFYLYFRRSLLTPECIKTYISLFSPFSSIPKEPIKWYVVILEALQLFYFSITMKLFSVQTYYVP